uniref:Macro domain-containing protein n=1 Tax=Plectus sambesii TaxID=2011161 RepID=A0A914XKL3_9BILA
MSWKKGKKSVLTSPKLTVEVYQGDLTLENTAAIVSTSNRRLKHEIGVAFALALAAGPELQAESDEWVSANGWLEVSEVAVTGAGQLAGRGVSNILHTVSPCFEDDAAGDETLAEQQLRVVYANCLHNAKALSLASIAFPGLSTGMLRVPAKVSAKAAIGALLEAAQADELGDINLVRFVDLAESTVKAFARELFDNRSMLPRHEWSIEEKEDNLPTLAAISSSTQKGLSLRATRSSTKNKNDENRNDLTEGDVSDEEGEEYAEEGEEVEEGEIEEGEEVKEKELDEYLNTAVNDSSNNRSFIFLFGHLKESKCCFVYRARR